MAKNHYLLTLLFVLIAGVSFSQTVPFPERPPRGEIGPWGYEQKGTNWDTSPYLPFYFNRENADDLDIYFRLMPPNDVTYNSSDNSWSNANPGELYPIILFFHGKGEAGTDNNNQLKHGGQRHRNAVQSGEFPGFLLYPQGAEAQEMKAVFDKLMEMGMPIDPSRVYVHGLSLGAKRTWEFALAYPELPAAIWPMSGYVGETDYSDLIYTPIRLAQGGRDRNPRPEYSYAKYEEIIAQGADMEYILIPNAGHGTWNHMYNRSDFFSWFLSHSANRVYAKYQYNEICPEDDIDVTLGVNGGNSNYEWRKDGVLLDGENTRELHVTEYGDYSARLSIEGYSTDWSAPITVSEKQPTQTPPITLETLTSYVLPDPNGNTEVTLTLPDGYEEYAWFNGGPEIAATQTYTAAPGAYTASVVERYGCSSIESEPFTVINNTGVDVPNSPGDVVATALSKTSMEITWTDNSNIETGIELYRRETISDDYEMIALLSPGTTSYQNTDLAPGTEYLYSLRAINANGASALSDEIAGTTESDTNLPSVPLNLTLESLNDNSVTLNWDPSTDDVGVARYDVYQDGVKVLTTQETFITVFSLIEGEIYSFNVVAVDLAGNNSPMSNRVVMSPVNSGLQYKYYHGTWSVLPDFNALTPVETGMTDNVDISLRHQNSNFGFLWEGKINIPVAGSYTFETYSDDGSKLYIGSYDEANLLVNNDGLHGSQFRSGTYDFPSAGSYDIAITFFERGGGERMEVYWSNTAHGIGSRQRIPSSAFSEEMVIPVEDIDEPSDFTGVGISTTEIQLTWSNSDPDVEQFQIFRADIDGVQFAPIALVDVATTSYIDSGLEPNTEYFYKIVALGEFGDSEGAVFDLSSAMQLNFDNGITDISGNDVVSTTSGIVNYVDDPKIQGSGAVWFQGNGSHINLDNGNQFIHNSFTERSVAFWLYTESTSGIQDIYDEGGATNGYGIRINNGSIELGVQNSHNQHQISAPINANEWVHVSTSFDNGRVELYVNGSLEASHDNVGYSTVNSHGDAAGLGASNGSNAFDQNNNNFNGWIDDFYIFGSVLSEAQIAQIIASVDKESTISAITDALPNANDPIENLTFEIMGQTMVELNWNANLAANAYLVLRSVGDDTNFRYLGMAQPDNPTFEDKLLDPHTDYYYMVSAISDNGLSPNSDTVLVSIPNAVPTFITEISDFDLFYTDEVNLLVEIEDLDGDDVAITGSSLPTFVQIIDNGDNTANLIIMPAASDFGTYNDLTIQLDDGYGGITNTTFNLQVESNHAPELTSVDDATMAGAESLQIDITATDEDGDAISWSTDGLPAFASSEVSPDGNTITLTFNPSLSNDGGIFNITVEATDDNAFDAKTSEVVFALTVIPYDPNHKIYVNLGNSNLPAGPEPWNNFTFTFPSAGQQMTNLVNDQGFATDASIRLETGWYSLSGGIYPGVYPNNVLWSSMRLNESETIRISGLDESSTYNFDFLGSSNGSGDRTTVYEIGGQSASIQTSLNTTDIARIEGVSPDINGEVFVTVSKHADADWGHLNAIVIEAVSSAGLPPLPPTNLAFELNNGAIELSWDDNSNNETQFEIYRSEVDNLNFTSLGTSEANTYSDNALTQNDLYYRVRAVNDFGQSEYSNEVVFIYTNQAPVIAGTEDVLMMPTANIVLDLTVTDPEGDDYDLEITGLPGFVSSEVVGDNITLTVAPTVYDLGTYTIDIVATDINANEGSLSFNIEVVEVMIDEVVNINFGLNGSAPAPSPWNNFISTPSAGTSFSDLINTDSENSGMALALVQSWTGGNTGGVFPGEYPDNAMNSFFADNSNNAKELTLSGLNPAKVYDLTFMGSRGGIADDRISLYTVNDVTKSLNVTLNAYETATISAQSPNASGELTISINKETGSSWKYLNAMVISSYSEPAYPKLPTAFNADAQSSSSILVTWNDESSNETGYELHYASNAEGPWTTVDLPADASEYLHDGLGRDETYFYKVNAYNAVSDSRETEVVSETTYNYLIHVNFGSVDYAAGAPWNNVLSDGPLVGDKFNDLDDADGNNTGIDIEVIANDMLTTFGGADRDITGGTTTGDDSGIYPDVVLYSYFWVEGIEVATLKLSQIPLNQEYDLEFLASRNRTDRLVSNYTVNGVTASVNATQNTSNTAVISDVVPDINGELVIDIQSNDSWAYINSLVIKASSLSGSTREVVDTKDADELASDLVESTISAYPNPFDQKLELTYAFEGAKVLNYAIFGQAGRVLRHEKLDIASSQGILNIETLDMLPGLYFIKVATDTGVEKVLKVIKR